MSKKFIDSDDYFFEEEEGRDGFSDDDRYLITREEMKKFRDNLERIMRENKNKKKDNGEVSDAIMELVK